MTERTGVWLVGALGGLATTVLAGARMLARTKIPTTGLATEGSEFAHLDLVPLARLVFGGHEIRQGSVVESAWQISRENGSLPHEALSEIESDLQQIDAAIRPGFLLGGGGVIERIAEPARLAPGGSLRECIARIQTDLEEFRAAEQVDRLVVVNLASTEPPLELRPTHQTLDQLEQALDEDRAEQVKASLLYAYSALDRGHAYINFTPSNAALVPAIEELAGVRGVPFMGSDGKTGETLVKSALAPMFRHRALRVLSWQGYNMLGDRDGEVLNEPENLKSKVESKDGVLPSILGYPVHTHVGIDYVPSLRDMKTAWDFIHFQGFLGFQMSMQFTWQGCDAVLAAPVVLDLIRLVDLAVRRGESGSLPHLACFFKRPHGCTEHDLHRQWQGLIAYAGRATP